MKHVHAKIVAVAGVIVFVLVLEISARVEDALKWNASITSNYSSESLRTVDSYGVHNRFGASFEKWRINQYGFRGPEIDIAAPPDVTRVICLGASETFGVYEKKDNEYPAQLRNMLEANNPGRFQVINAASFGTSVVRATQHFQLWLAQFKPDIVLLYPSPAFYLDENPPGTKLPAQGSSKKEQFESRLKGKAKLTIKKALPQNIQNTMREIEIYAQVKRHPDNWVWHTPPPDRLNIYREHIIDFIETVRSCGGQPVLLTHTHRFNENLTAEDRYQLTSWRKFYPRATEKCLIAMEHSANEVVRGVGRKYNVPVIDLDKTISKAPENFVDFAHFTDTGARLVAEELVRAVTNL